MEKRRLIDANALWKALKASHDQIMANGDIMGSMGGTIKGVLDLVEEIPTEDVEPVRHGHWVDKNPFYKDFAPARYVCSECGRAVEHFQCKTVTEQYPYCHCGAKMDGGKENAVD